MPQTNSNMFLKFNVIHSRHNSNVCNAIYTFCKMRNYNSVEALQRKT